MHYYNHWLDFVDTFVLGTFTLAAPTPSFVCYHGDEDAFCSILQTSTKKLTKSSADFFRRHATSSSSVVALQLMASPNLKAIFDTYSPVLNAHWDMAVPLCKGSTSKCNENAYILLEWRCAYLILWTSISRYYNYIHIYYRLFSYAYIHHSVKDLSSLTIHNPMLTWRNDRFFFFFFFFWGGGGGGERGTDRSTMKQTPPPPPTSLVTYFSIFAGASQRGQGQADNATDGAAIYWVGQRNCDAPVLLNRLFFLS